MPNDAKLGLAVGVGLVIFVAVLYYRTESSASTADPAATIVQPEQISPAPPPRRNKRTPATSTASANKGASTQVASRRHTVRAGDTFQTLARRYYGAEEKEAILAGANGAVANEDGSLKPGTTVLIPTMDDGERQ
jgi:nucleoid-associated protein YgaU